MLCVYHAPEASSTRGAKKTFAERGIDTGGGFTYFARLFVEWGWRWAALETRIQMEAYAVIETGGKQYRVQQGDVVSVELIEGAEAGQTVEVGRVLAVNDGSGLKTGAPVVDGAKVTAEVVEDYRAPKVVAFKKKRRKGYHRKVGHRQHLLKVKIASIA
jgi:large subunit ribosomal protein L21